MNQIPRDDKTRLSLSVNADLVRDAQALGVDLPEKAAELLAAYVRARQAKLEADQKAVDATIAWANDRYDKFGLAGADFSPL